MESAKMETTCTPFWPFDTYDPIVGIRATVHNTNRQDLAESWAASRPSRFRHNTVKEVPPLGHIFPHLPYSLFYQLLCLLQGLGLVERLWTLHQKNKSPLLPYLPFAIRYPSLHSPPPPSKPSSYNQIGTIKVRQHFKDRDSRSYSSSKNHSCRLPLNAKTRSVQWDTYILILTSVWKCPEPVAPAGTWEASDTAWRGWLHLIWYSSSNENSGIYNRYIVYFLPGKISSFLWQM